MTRGINEIDPVIGPVEGYGCSCNGDPWIEKNISFILVIINMDFGSTPFPFLIHVVHRCITWDFILKESYSQAKILMRI